MDLSALSQAQSFQFSSAYGHALCRRILSDHLPYDPHDYQIEGVCKALDGVDLLAVTPTGSGKTGFMTMYLLVVREIANNRTLCPQAPVKQDPAMLVICPTKSLEVDMDPKFRSVGLSTIIINADTTDKARRGGEDLWKSACMGVSAILLSPEQLKSKGFEYLLQNKAFQARIAAVSVDEAHLLDQWGADFRPAFRQIGHMRMRLPGTPVLIALTATLRIGAPQESVCRFLGLHADSFHLIRRSNMRHDIQLLFREIQSSARATSFPELDWVLDAGRRIIIFCRTISFGHRVATYLWHKSEGIPGLQKWIRLYNALNWPDYNDETLRDMREDPHPWITIATDTLATGIDAANTDDVVLYDLELPPNSDMVLQKGGRIRDGKHKNSRFIVYLPRNAIEKSLAKSAEPSVARLIAAKCKVKAIDELYNNPPEDVKCTCKTCIQNPPTPRRVPCDCSGCMPEALARLTPVAATRPAAIRAPVRERVTKKMRAHGTAHLVLFRRKVWEEADECLLGMMPSEEFLPDSMIQSLLDNFATLTDILTVAAAIDNHLLLSNYHSELFSILNELRQDFEKMRAEAKAAASVKRKETKERKKREAAEMEKCFAGVGELEMESDTESDEDGVSAEESEGETRDVNTGAGREITLIRIPGRQLEQSAGTIRIPGGRVTKPGDALVA